MKKFFTVHGPVTPCDWIRKLWLWLSPAHDAASSGGRQDCGSEWGHGSLTPCRGWRLLEASPITRASPTGIVF